MMRSHTEAESKQTRLSSTALILLPNYSELTRKLTTTHNQENTEETNTTPSQVSNKLNPVCKDDADHIDIVNNVSNINSMISGMNNIVNSLSDAKPSILISQINGLSFSLALFDFMRDVTNFDDIDVEHDEQTTLKKPIVK